MIGYTTKKRWSRKGRCPSCNVNTGSNHSKICTFTYSDEINMKNKSFTSKEIGYYAIRQACFYIVYIPTKIGNWATNKLNKSYYEK